MRFMIVVRYFQNLKDGSLTAYTGVIHETKQEALTEYVKAVEDPDVIGLPLIVLV